MPDTTTKPDYEQTYDDFWRELVERPDGTLDRDKVMRELHDFRSLMRSAGEVYSELTGYRISKPNTTADAVIGVAQEVARRDGAGRAADELAAVMENDMTTDEISAKIAELRAEAAS